MCVAGGFAGTFSNNTINNNDGFGISIELVEGSTEIVNNIITNNGVGIELQYIYAPLLIANNMIAGNDDGIELEKFEAGE